MDARIKKLKLNTLSSVIYQFVTIVCGFILPRLMLVTYGSEANGLLNSINQFLSIISFLELGVGSVVRSALYKPLYNKDNDQISRIIASADKFFNRIARILLIYGVILLIFFPLIINNDFDWLYIDTLIIAIFITELSQYYLGIVNGLLISADQKNYILYNLKTITLIINVLLCYLFISLGFSIQVVRFTTSIVFLFRPVFLTVYIKKHYKINRKIKYFGEPLRQKWNGIAQHVASVILGQTDTIVLTIFSTLSNVSIYAVYYLPVAALEQLISFASNGFESFLGSSYASNDVDEINSIYSKFIWLVHFIVIVLFGCASNMILPFVALYTKGVTDSNYYQPLFAAILLLGYTLFCLRIPASTLIKAIGHYKQTQHIFIISSVVNLVISILLVHFYGLIGVAVGTFVAMLYQSIALNIYASIKILNKNKKIFLVRILCDVLVAVVASIVSSFVEINASTVVGFIVLGLIEVAIWISVSCIFNFVFYRDILKWIIRRLRNNEG